MSQVIEQELDLVLRAQAGDKEAFAALYDAYFERIYDFGFQMVRNHDDSADLVAEVFLKAMERLGTLKDPAAFRGWLYAVARNAALSMIERRGRTTAMPEEAEDTYTAPPGTGVPDPAESAENSELTALVWEAAGTLNPRDYSIFEMVTRQGLDSAEVADALGVKPSHAYVLVSRLKDSVEEALGAVVLARAGRRDCPDLDAIVAEFGGERSPRMRKAVLRHLHRCDECKSSKKKYASAAALLGGVAFAMPGPGLKEAVAQNISNLWPVKGPGAGGGDGHQPGDGRLSRLVRGGAVPTALVIFVIVAVVQNASPSQMASNLWPFRVQEATPTPAATPVPAVEETPPPTPPPAATPAEVATRGTSRPQRATQPPPTHQPTAQPTHGPQSTVIIVTSAPGNDSGGGDTSTPPPDGGCETGCDSSSSDVPR